MQLLGAYEYDSYGKCIICKYILFMHELCFNCIK